ncbi:MAG: extracellular solute-binding protein [Treponema sp.]|jgi:putative aldouronate transport system substrate-binding protein|nr:extracellular solute-binding protein [Treponema sp.]
MKRWFFLWAAFFIAASLVFAGGGRQAGSSGASGPVKLSIFVNMSWYPTNSFTGIIPEEITRQTGVILDPTVAVDGQQLGVMIASGELPDLVYTDTLLDQMSDGDICYSYEELISRYNVDWKLSAQRLGIARSKSQDGKAYYTPNNLSENASDWVNSSAVPMAASLIYRTDLYKAVGSPPLKNFDDLFNLFTAVKQKYPNMGAVLKLNRDWNTAVFRVNMGLPGIPYVEQSNGTYMWPQHDARYKQAIAFLNKCWRAGFISPDESYFVVGSEAIPDGEWFAFSGCTQNHLPDRLAALQKINPSYTVAEMVPFDTANYQASNIGWCGTFITKKNKNPEASIKLMKWMFSDEGIAACYMGRKGVDYTQEPGQLPKFSAEWNAALNDGTLIQKYNNWWYLGGNPIVESESRIATTDPALVKDAYSKIRSKYSNAPWIAAAAPIGNSDEKIIADKLTELSNTYEPRLIMAKTEAEFETIFKEFIANADQIGAAKLETFVNNKIKEIKPRYQ